GPIRPGRRTDRCRTRSGRGSAWVRVWSGCRSGSRMWPISRASWIRPSARREGDPETLEERNMAVRLGPYRDLLKQKKPLAHLATVMADGSPQVTPVWFDWDGTHIRVNSAKGRIKDRNMRARPTVALSIVDPDNVYRYLSIRGRVTAVTERGADAHIDALAK